MRKGEDNEESGYSDNNVNKEERGENEQGDDENYGDGEEGDEQSDDVDSDGEGEDGGNDEDGDKKVSRSERMAIMKMKWLRRGNTVKNEGTEAEDD